MMALSPLASALRLSRVGLSEGMVVSEARAAESSCSPTNAAMGSDLLLIFVHRAATSLMSPPEIVVAYGGACTQPSRDLPSKIRIIPAGKANVGAGIGAAMVVGMPAGAFDCPRVEIGASCSTHRTRPTLQRNCRTS